MADENNEPQGGEDFDAGSLIAEVREKHGVNLMTEDALNKRLAKEKAKRESLETDFAAIKSQHEEAQAELQKFQDRGKSDDQKRAEDTAKMEKQIRSYKEQLAQEQARSAEYQRSIKQRDLRERVSGVIGDKAANLRRATLIALNELDGVDLGEDGSLVYTDPSTEIPYTGDDAVKHIQGWWEKQTDLHRASGGNGPPPANPRPTGEQTREYGELTDEERFARRHAGV